MVGVKCPAGATVANGGIFPLHECVVLRRNVSREFRLQQAQFGGGASCTLSFEANQGPSWSLDQVHVKLVNMRQSCDSGGQIDITAKLDNKAGGRRVTVDSASQTVLIRTLDTVPGPYMVSLTGTKNNRRTKVNPGQVVVTLTYQKGICTGPDDIEGTVVLDFGYVVYNYNATTGVVPGSIPGQVNRSSGCVAGRLDTNCNWFVPQSWCDCTGLGAGMFQTGFGTIGCETLLVFGGALGLIFLVTILK